MIALVEADERFLYLYHSEFKMLELVASYGVDVSCIKYAKDGDNNGSAVADIGAFEFVFEQTFTVTKIEDTDDGTCDADCSLREAIAAANATDSDDTIGFASPLFDTAQTAYKKNDSVTALMIWLPLAESGDLKSQFTLAKL